MNRRYTTKQFEKIVELIRKNYKDAILTTDIIVGFPGETEEEFNKTYEFLKKIKFYKMHVFKYSKRKGTKAATMQMQIDGNIKEIRSQKLIELSNRNEREYNKLYIGKEVEVLFEERKEGVYKGHTKNYILVYLPEKYIHNNEKIENEIINVKCEKNENNFILATL